MPRSRTRGGLTSILAEADQVAGARLKGLISELDRITEAGGASPFGGGQISRGDFRRLLANDPGTLRDVAARFPFASEGEKRALQTDIQRAFAPPAQAVPPMPMADDAARTTTGQTAEGVE
jgi:hypothetical protein